MFQNSVTEGVLSVLKSRKSDFYRLRSYCRSSINQSRIRSERRELKKRLSTTWPNTTAPDELFDPTAASRLSQKIRAAILDIAELPEEYSRSQHDIDLIWKELYFIHDHADLLRPYFDLVRGKRVLFSGQCYYNHWYLSRELRVHGWQSDLLNWDLSAESQIYYHGQDFQFKEPMDEFPAEQLLFYLKSLYEYDIFHFANAHGISFGSYIAKEFEIRMGQRSEIFLLKALGKRVCYTNNGCLDGVKQSSFARWGPESPCSICKWRKVPSVCSDRRNNEWGTFRNLVSDYQCLLGGNRADNNISPLIHETPQIYCLDKDIWNPRLTIPEHLRIEGDTIGTVQLYHAVGNRDARTASDGKNIKSSHIYLPLIDKLRSEGIKINLISPTNVPNKDVRFLQLQADIFLEMLTFGWFGANAREAMMLEKPVICFLRPEWLESLAAELPDYVKELPIISATPETVEPILRELIADPQRRAEIGKASRAFALKWHSREAAAQKFDTIYRRLLKDEEIVVPHYA